jgi:hypothetical protein
MDEQLLYQVSLVFLSTAGQYIHGLEAGRLAAKTLMRRFVAHFGVTPRHCAYLWLFIEQRAISNDVNAKHIHLLWTLNLLKTNTTEHCLAGCWCPDKKTIRKWTSIFIDTLSTMEVVSVFAYLLCYILLYYISLLLHCFL